MKNSREGVCWTPASGVVHGIPSISVVEPSKSRVPSSGSVLDVIVIGAGYTGLVAARELARQKRRVLLLEGRDRIGGRTWHSTIDGFNYEMGGTWIHWHMPHIYHEVSRYGLQDDWIVTQTPGGAHDYLTLSTNGAQVNMPHSTEEAMATKVWGTFCNLDSSFMRSTMTYPLSANLSEKYDGMSCQDRLDEIKHQLTAEETGMLEAILLQMGGGPLDRMGLTDALRWWSLGGFTGTGLNDIGLTTRLRSGQSALARAIFDDAVKSGLSYSFSSPVSKIEDHSQVTVSLRSGEQFIAKQVICTVPLNVLGDISFDPPLPAKKAAAIADGSVQKCNKVHFDLEGPDLVSWTGLASPGTGLISAISDNLTPANDTHLVTFGPSADSPRGIKLANNVSGVRAALDHLLPFPQKVNRIVYHDWFADEFAKGTWCYLPPQWVSKYLKEMQKPHGNVMLSSADWSNGWRGWIDGAAEQGIKAADRVGQHLDQGSRSSHL